MTENEAVSDGIDKLGSGDELNLAELITFTSLVKAWGELLSARGEEPDPLQALLLYTVNVLQEDDNGVSLPQVLELLFCRELTHAEERYIRSNLPLPADVELFAWEREEKADSRSQEQHLCHSEKTRSVPNKPSGYSKVLAPVNVSLDAISRLERPLLELLVRAFLELRTASGESPEKDPMKMILLCALREVGSAGFTAVKIMERFLCRPLSGQEEEYVIFATESSVGHA